MRVKTRVLARAEIRIWVQKAIKIGVKVWLVLVETVLASISFLRREKFW